MVSAKSVLIAASATAAVAGISYAVYFDYKRRHDRKFRRKLQRDRKKAEKAAQKTSKASSADINERAIELLNIVTKEKLPASAEEKEQFFMAQVSKGETLCAAGESGYAEAACRFYQALKVYPNPIELVMIYQRTTPEEVFKLVMAMMAQEVKQKQARYFDVFPPKDKNVEIKDKNKSSDKKAAGKSKKAAEAESTKDDDVVIPDRGLFATKEFAAGDIVFEEESVISTLLPRAQNGQFCYHCLKAIPGASPRAKKPVAAAAAAAAAEDDEAPAAIEESKIEEIEDSEPAVAEEAEETAKEETEAKETTEEEPTVEAEAEAEPEAEPEAAEEKTEATEEATAPDATEEKENKEENKEEEEEKEEDTQEGEDKVVLECTKCHEAVYCSEKCRQDAYDAYHQFLCPSASNPVALEFAQATRDTHELAPILIAKFFGTLVDREKKKELARALGDSADEEAKDDEYTTWEHLERMRYLELVPTTNDGKMLSKLGKLMSSSVPGLSEFVTEERYTMLKGKLDYNAYAVHTADGVEVPAETEATHVSDTVRDDHVSSAVGLSLYLVASHLAHDCDPNAQIVFPENTDKAAIKALKPIAKGDELRISYVDVSLDKEARHKVLKGSYRIDCTCKKCQSETAPEPEPKAEASTEAKTEASTEAKAEDEEDAE
ncbi:mitochondrial import receptor subunit tom20 [Dipsacomyces acuminosporus]|nr:mitochondrial import receptor subunit tom20 [Dipsacomyces acuminosporus]